MSSSQTLCGAATLNTSAGTTNWANNNSGLSSDAELLNGLTAGGFRDIVVNGAAFAPSYYVLCTSYGFSIPTGATIDGIKVDLQEYANADSGAPTWTEVKIIKGGSISGNDLSGGASFVDTTSYQSRTFGSSTELWGLSFTYSDINASNFGMAFRATNSSQAAHMRLPYITVYYTEASSGPPKGQLSLIGVGA